MSEEGKQPVTIKLTQLEVMGIYVAGILIGVLLAVTLFREEHSH